VAAATALWSGVQALNGEARRSYQAAVDLAGGDGATALVSPGGGRVSAALFGEMRRAGWRVSPVLEGSVLLAGDRPRFLRVVGLEPLSLPAGSSLAGALVALGGDGEQDDADVLSDEQAEEQDGAAFIRPPFQALAAPDFLEEFGLDPGDRVTLADGRRSPPIFPSGAAPPGALLVDMGAAEALLDAQGLVDRFLLDGAAPAPPGGSIEEASGGRLTVQPARENDFGRLTGSFHLNLTAFGLLSFVVGLFIAYAAIGLAFEQRRATLRTVRALGVSARTAAAALLVEITVLALVAGVAGLALGYAIAGALAPDVAITLRGLYGAPASGSLRLDPIWALSGLAMSLAGAWAAAAQSLLKSYGAPVLSSVGAEAWRQAQRRWLLWQGGAGALFLAAAAGLAGYAQGGGQGGLLLGFGLLGCLLLGAALALPAALSGVLEAARGAARGPLSLWFWSDARREIGGLSLALAALLLALAANIGVGAMVGGFRVTFNTWIDARLAAEVYADGRDAAHAAEMRAWAADQPGVRAVLPDWGAEIRLGGWPVELRGFVDHATYRDNWPLLSAGAAPWDRVAAGEAALISEQLARRQRLSVGDVITLPGSATAGGAWPVEIAAIYADYGNPKGQVFVHGPTLAERFDALDVTGFALRVAPDRVTEVVEAMRAQFNLGPDGVIDQGNLKRFAMAIFERTFAITGALNALTLGVAGVALFASLAALSGRRLAQLAPLWAMGLPRRRLAALDLAQTLALALLTALLAVPVGMALAWALVAVVNVEAFGWRLPLTAFPGEWARLILLALVAAAIASAPAFWRLRRTPPERLLRIMAQDR
ncbi:MAG: FtsX-like permease family protein, partial [Pseudomonadota bacterium]